MEGEHGFNTREEWQNYFQIYFDQIRELEEINSFQMNKEPQQWLADFSTKAQKLEKKYQEQNVYLQQHVYYFTREGHPWTRNIADPLLSFLYRYSTRFEDIAAAYELARSLYAFYETQNDPVALMKCDMVILSVYFFLNVKCLKKEIMELYQHAIPIFEAFYDQLNEEEKSLGMSFYDFQSFITSEYANEPPFIPVSRFFEEYENRMQMLHRFKSEADMSLPLNSVISYFENHWTSNFLRLTIHSNANAFSQKQLRIQLSIARHLKDQHPSRESPEGYAKYQALCLMLEYFLKEKTAATVHQEIMNCERILPHKRFCTFEEYDDENIDCFNLILSCMLVLVTDCPDCVLSIRQIFTHLLDVYNHFPSNTFMESVADINTSLYLIPAVRYLEEDKILPTLLKLTVYRQPQTLFHSVILSRCAKLVTGHMIDQHPEYLIGVLSCQSEAEVNRRKDEILNFIETGALLHDIGKIHCTNVINMQYRKLVDIEFQVIKYHPVSSLKILQQIPSLHKYIGIAAGHHKSSDGTCGYPSDFDAVNVPDKIMIDIISICDSLDAATDYLGRSYARTKTLSQVLGELQAGSGTRYSANVVNLISDSPELQHELEQFLLHRREDVCLEVYQKIKRSGTLQL